MLPSPLGTRLRAARSPVLVRFVRSGPPAPLANLPLRGWWVGSTSRSPARSRLCVRARARALRVR
eukprot:5936886-Pleurochrysis_carterae.AAC.4